MTESQLKELQDQLPKRLLGSAGFKPKIRECYYCHKFIVLLRHVARHRKVIRFDHNSVTWLDGDVERTDLIASCDHIVPLCRGGTNTPENKVWACRDCNEEKGELTIQEFIGVKNELHNGVSS